MRLLAVPFALLLATGCKDKVPSAQPTVGSGGSGAVAITSGPRNETDARAFAEELAAQIPPCNEATLVDRIVTPNPADAPVAARLLCQWMAGVTSYKVVGVRTVGGVPHPVLRRLLADPKSGAMFVNYDELTLGRAPSDGSLRLADVFSYRQGLGISELLAANAGSGSAPTEFLGASAKHAEVRTARDRLRDGDRAGALAALDALPPEVRKERGVQLLRVRAAVGVDTAAYKQALTELAQTFPDDPAIALTQIDGALDIGDNAGAQKWIDTLETVTGPDAYLESTRVVALIRQGDLDTALARANAAVALEPTLTRALEIKLDVLIAKKQWADVLAVMTELETKHDSRFEIDKLRAEPRLAELVASPLFKQWLDERTQR